MDHKQKLLSLKITRLGELKQAVNYYMEKFRETDAIEARDLYLSAKADLVRVENEYTKMKELL